MPFSISPELAALFEEHNISQKDRDIVVDDLLKLTQLDKETGEHSLRVLLLSVRIAKYLGLRAKPFILAAGRHDIGKLDVPKELVRTRKRYTLEERRLMAPHAEHSYARIKATNHRFSAELAREHHPVTDREAPKTPREALLARYQPVIAIADHFDTMMHRRHTHFGGTTPSIAELKDELIRTFPAQKRVIQKLMANGILVLRPKRKLFRATRPTHAVVHHQKLARAAYNRRR